MTESEPLEDTVNVSVGEGDINGVPAEEEGSEMVKLGGLNKRPESLVDVRYVEVIDSWDSEQAPQDGVIGQRR